MKRRYVLTAVILVLFAVFVLLCSCGKSDDGKKSGLKCGKCEIEYDDGIRFCTNCGEELKRVIVCSACEWENDESAQFCSGCGMNLTEKQDANVQQDGSHIEEDLVQDNEEDLDLLPDSSGGNGGNTDNSGNSNGSVDTDTNEGQPCLHCEQSGWIECGACDGTGEVFKKFDEKGNKIMKKCTFRSTYSYCTDGKVKCYYCKGDGIFLN